ncbi:MAG: hypothetical protein ACK5MI_09865 [Mangrovibacterium sp.]
MNTKKTPENEMGKMYLLGRIRRDAPAFFSCITRVQSFLQMGKSDNDFLYYLPIYDIWEGQKGNFFTTPFMACASVCLSSVKA